MNVKSVTARKATDKKIYILLNKAPIVATTPQNAKCSPMRFCSTLKLQE